MNVGLLSQEVADHLVRKPTRGRDAKFLSEWRGPVMMICNMYCEYIQYIEIDWTYILDTMRVISHLLE